MNLKEIVLSLQEHEKKTSDEMDLLKNDIILLKNENRRMNQKLADMENAKQVFFRIISRRNDLKSYFSLVGMCRRYIIHCHEH